tara:strand:- start:12322 stop:13557 length:1236 start_codon:yes stop_codon:yes gene_type:complete
MQCDRTAISLFTGIGGLDLGFEAAGFSVALAVEKDDHCRQVLHSNRPGWQLSTPGDVSVLTARKILRQANLRKGEVDVLIAGPPCQPFSKSRLWVNGQAPGLRDSRAETLDHLMEMVAGTLPKVVVIENVNGISSANAGAPLRRIQSRFDQINGRFGTYYEPIAYQLNAADYGVPQLRKRVFIIAEINGKEFVRPKPTHVPEDNLSGRKDGLVAYLNAWDAIGDLDGPQFESSLRPTGKWAQLLPSIPEGQNYLWHTERGGGLPLFGWRTKYWSFLLKLGKHHPSWTLQASPGPATGPFHWRNRRLTPREMARLQTFPDSFELLDQYRETTRQIGNAVPPRLAEAVAREVMKQFFEGGVSRKFTFELPKSDAIPRRHPTRPVAIQYRNLCAAHRAHPGPGKGPRARAIASR